MDGQKVLLPFCSTLASYNSPAAMWRTVTARGTWQGSRAALAVVTFRLSLTVCNIYSLPVTVYLGSRCDPCLSALLNLGQLALSPIHTTGRWAQTEEKHHITVGTLPTNRRRGEKKTRGNPKVIYAPAQRETPLPLDVSRLQTEPANPLDYLGTELHQHMRSKLV